MPSIAVTVRRDKESNPDRFCPARGCLWRVKDRDGAYIGPCGKHGDMRVGRMQRDCPSYHDCCDSSVIVCHCVNVREV